MGDSELNRKKYTVPGGAAYQLRVKNAIHISPSVTIRHEMSKCLGAYMLRKWGDVNFSERTKQILRELQSEVEHHLKDWVKVKCDFITEAVPKIDKNRRIDLVDIENDIWFEFETNHKVKKDASVSVYI